MKKTAKLLSALLLAFLMLLSPAACGGQKADKEGLWQNATYTEDKTFGTGSKTVQVEVKVNDRSVTFTLKTDKEMLGDALLEHDLIAGDEGEFGLYVKKVNGITADYDVDQSYWSLCQNGEMLMTGVDGTAITDGAHYELVYAK